MFKDPHGRHVPYKPRSHKRTIGLQPTTNQPTYLYVQNDELEFSILKFKLIMHKYDFVCVYSKIE